MSEHTTRGRRYLLPLLILGAVLLLSACAGPDRLGLESVVDSPLPQNSLDPAGPAAERIDSLWWLVFTIATVIFVVVEAVLIFTVLRYRRRNDTDRPVKQVHGNMRFEIIWTIIPAVLLAVVAVPTMAALFDLRAEPLPSDNALEIDVIGHQWWWEFQYPDYGFTTANELHIPAGRVVQLNMTSTDVIHSFWTPRLNGKRDVVPGRVSMLLMEANEPGLYIGQCAEFCGLAHADMRHRVFAHTAEDFEAWAQAQAQPAAIPETGAAADGWATFQVVCASCHAIDGTSANAQLAPNLTHFAARTTFGGASFANTEDHLREWLANPSDLKPMRPELNDLTNGRVLGMPNLGLTDDEIDNLIALLETLE